VSDEKDDNDGMDSGSSMRLCMVWVIRCNEACSSATCSLSCSFSLQSRSAEDSNNVAEESESADADSDAEADVDIDVVAD
jgi:hypothetical protein